jgi:hypothetical protein
MYRKGNHPRSLENLERHKFQKGQSGNPRGRPPKELCITDITREQLGEPCSKDPSKTWAKYLSDKWLDLACENIQAFKELMERLEGKVVFPVRAENPPDIVFTIGKGYENTDQ